MLSVIFSESFEYFMQLLFFVYLQNCFITFRCYNFIFVCRDVKNHLFLYKVTQCILLIKAYFQINENKANFVKLNQSTINQKINLINIYHRKHGYENCNMSLTQL